MSDLNIADRDYRGRRSSVIQLVHSYHRSLEFDYQKAKQQVVTFLTSYWIPACVSARLLHVSTSAAYEWIAEHPCPPRRAWFCSPLHNNGRRRRGRINRAVELYQNPEMTMRQVSVRLDVEASTVYRYLQTAGRSWYQQAAEKHEAFALRYPTCAARIERMYEEG